MGKERIIRSHFVQVQSENNVRLLKDHYLYINQQGKIKKLTDKVPAKADQSKIVDWSDSLVMPGFYDMHFHWVQWTVCPKPKDSLITWLKTYVFPTEKRFKNKEFAQKQAKKFFKHLAACGTIGGAVYGSIHPHTVDLVFKYGLGHYIAGHPLMTMNSPKGLTHTPKEAAKLIKKYSKQFREKYALTPRFAPSTDHGTMSLAGELASKHGSFIQTHLSETEEEIEWVMSLFQGQKGFKNLQSYSDIYDRCSLLGPRSLLAHGIHLTADDYRRLRKTRSAIVHCPTSNAPKRERGLGSGLFDYRAAEKAKIRWALGSDIGAGPYCSMFDVMRSFIIQNRKVHRKVNWSQALYRATLAGAEILQVEKENGSLVKGKWANLIQVKTNKKTLDLINKKKINNIEPVLEELILSKSKSRKTYDQIVRSTYYRGKKIN
jgi:guanine deaminase